MKEISEIVRQFKEIVQATLDGNAKKVALEYGHDKEIPFYNTRITSNGAKCEIEMCIRDSRRIRLCKNEN